MRVLERDCGQVEPHFLVRGLDNVAEREGGERLRVADFCRRRRVLQARRRQRHGNRVVQDRGGQRRPGAGVRDVEGGHAMDGRHEPVVESIVRIAPVEIEQQYADGGLARCERRLRGDGKRHAGRLGGQRARVAGARGRRKRDNLRLHAHAAGVAKHHGVLARDGRQQVRQGQGLE